MVRRELPTLPRSLEGLRLRRASSGSAAEAIYGRRIFSNSYTKSPTVSLHSLSIEEYDNDCLEGGLTDPQEPVVEFDEYGNKIFTREVVLNMKKTPAQRKKSFKRCGNHLGVKISWVRGQVHIIDVIKGSLAETCGLCVGDEIIEINTHAIDDGFSIETINELLNYVESEMKIIIKDHKGKHITIEAGNKELNHTSFGITVREGKVSNVEPGSVAAMYNIEPGLGIVVVNGKSALGRSDSYITRKINHRHKKRLSLSLLDGTLRDELTMKLLINTSTTHTSSTGGI